VWAVGILLVVPPAVLLAGARVGPGDPFKLAAASTALIAALVVYGLYRLRGTRVAVGATVLLLQTIGFGMHLAEGDVALLVRTREAEQRALERGRTDALEIARRLEGILLASPTRSSSWTISVRSWRPALLRTHSSA